MAVHKYVDNETVTNVELKKKEERRGREQRTKRYDIYVHR
jgi:hypothetical protein